MAKKSSQSFREKVDLALNESRTLGGQLFEVFTSILVIVLCGIFVLQTYAIPENLFNFFISLETVITFFFLIEYIIRWWAKSFSLRYLFSFMAIIDFIAILPLFLSAHFQFIRILRLFRILRLLRFFEHRRLFLFTLTDYHLRLTKVLFTLFCIVFIFSGLIYDIEHKHNPKDFRTFFDAFYYAIVTLSTVGFGDIAPLSTTGRALTLAMIISGAIFIPWQVSDLIKSIFLSAKKKKVLCKHCGLTHHDPDATYCKACGNLIFQKYISIT